MDDGLLPMVHGHDVHRTSTSVGSQSGLAASIEMTTIPVAATLARPFDWAAIDPSEKTIAVIGLGYVGLPLATEFGKLRPVVGFDLRQERIAELQSGRDRTLEVEPDELSAATHSAFTSTPDDLKTCGILHHRGSDTDRSRQPPGPCAARQGIRGSRSRDEQRGHRHI